MKLASISILILILLVCGAVKSRSTEILVASAAAAAEPKLKGAETNRRLMALSEEDRRSVFGSILALAKEHCAKITRTFYQQPATAMERKVSWRSLIRHKSGATRRG